MIIIMSLLMADERFIPDVSASTPAVVERRPARLNVALQVARIFWNMSEQLIL